MVSDIGIEIMDYASCNVVYLDKRIRDDRYETRSRSQPLSSQLPKSAIQIDTETLEPDLERNIETLTKVFQGGKRQTHQGMLE